MEDTEKDPKIMDLRSVGENELSMVENYKLPNLLSMCF